MAGKRNNIDKANRTDGRIQNLTCYIDVGLLRAIHKCIDRNKASWVDRETKEVEYEANLDENLKIYVERLKAGTYRL